MKKMKKEDKKLFSRCCILGAIGGIFMVVVALAIHLWAATLAWFSTYLGPRIGAEAAVTAVTAYQNDMRNVCHPRPDVTPQIRRYEI